MARRESKVNRHRWGSLPLPGMGAARKCTCTARRTGETMWMGDKGWHEWRVLVVCWRWWLALGHIGPPGESVMQVRSIERSVPPRQRKPE